MLYDDYILKLSKKIENYFDEITIEFNFDNGPEFEIAICKILREFLPSKYGICRGFVVNSKGKKKGDDIIIFDKDRFPTLRLLKSDDYSIKEFIPIDAVYAYIEAKHTLTKSSFNKSLKQIIEVKKICDERPKMKIYQLDPYIDTDLNLPIVLDHLPKHRNPVFGMILSRFGIKNKNKDIDKVNEFLEDKLKDNNVIKVKSINFKYFPELIIAGNSNFLSTAFLRDGRETVPTLFHLSENNSCNYQVMMTKDLAFGISFAHLIAALDYIRLSKMPWEDILNESKTGSL